MAEHKTRKRWIKLWTQETLHGTTLRELLPDERAVWFEFLCLAGDSVIPGSICIAENIPYTDEQLSLLLAVDIELLKRAILKMQQHGKINKNGTGVIEICNFIQYQGEFDKAAYMTDYMPQYRAGLRRREQSKTDVKSYNVKSNDNISTNVNSTVVTAVEQTRTDNIREDNTKEIIYKEIFTFWNKQKIVVHQKITEAIKKAIVKALKTYTHSQIKSAILTYGDIVTHPGEYTFTYRWSLQEFLSRENAIVKFTDDTIAKQNYKRDRKTNQSINTNSKPKFSKSPGEKIKDYESGN